MLKMGAKNFAKSSSLLNLKLIKNAKRLTRPINAEAWGARFSVGNIINNIPIDNIIILYGVRMRLFNSIFKDSIKIRFKVFQKMFIKN